MILHARLVREDLSGGVAFDQSLEWWDRVNCEQIFQVEGKNQQEGSATQG